MNELWKSIATYPTDFGVVGRVGSVAAMAVSKALANLRRQVIWPQGRCEGNGSPRARTADSSLAEGQLETSR